MPTNRGLPPMQPPRRWLYFRNDENPPTGLPLRLYSYASIEFKKIAAPVGDPSLQDHEGWILQKKYVSHQVEGAPTARHGIWVWAAFRDCDNDRRPPEYQRGCWVRCDGDRWTNEVLGPCFDLASTTVRLVVTEQLILVARRRMLVNSSFE